jgi:hypothetical protein
MVAATFVLPILNLEENVNAEAIRQSVDSHLVNDTMVHIICRRENHRKHLLHQHAGMFPVPNFTELTGYAYSLFQKMSQLKRYSSNRNYDI